MPGGAGGGGGKLEVRETNVVAAGRGSVRPPDEMSVYFANTGIVFFRTQRNLGAEAKDGGILTPANSANVGLTEAWAVRERPLPPGI